ncbi:MAG: SDR family NAD(P)-dependent oxidoreductase, partial [Candidatus Odinarchaeia archaeon]
MITGESRGIGRQIAIDLANKGAKIAANYLQSKSQALNLRESLNKVEFKCEIFKADVSNSNSIKKMIDSVLKVFRSIGILINNAGIMKINPDITKISDAEWDETINVNLKGVFNCCRYVVPLMTANKLGV